MSLIVSEYWTLIDADEARVPQAKSLGQCTWRPKREIILGAELADVLGEDVGEFISSVRVGGSSAGEASR